MKHVALFVLVAPFGLSFASAAAAAEPTKQECAAANESAQDLRTAGRFREARTALAVCTAATCPGPIREDCAQRLNDVVAAQPTVVFDAKSDLGQDLTAVHVTMDDAPLVDTLNGVAIPVDPGRHRLVFDAVGFHRNASLVVVREGERGRRVRVVLKPDIAPAPAAPAETSSSSIFDPGTRRTLGLVSGATGAAGIVLGTVFAILAKSTYDHALQSECGGDWRHCSLQGTLDGQTAYSQATLSTVGVIMGGALLAGGAALYFTAPRETGVAIGGSVGSGGGGLALSAKW